MAQNSGVLIVGPARPALTELGADTAPDFASAKIYLKNQQPSVLVFTGDREFSEQAAQLSPESLWIVAIEGVTPSLLIHLNNFGRLVDLVDGLDDPALETKLKSALEAAGLERQRRELAGLFEEQAALLKRLTNELESRVDKRHKTLRKSLHTLDETKIRLEAFHKALLGIHRASTVLQMEQSLNEALVEPLDIAWVRVRFANQSLLSRQLAPGVLTIDIPFRDPDPNAQLRGEAMFCKKDGKKFSNAEVDFLHELCEALALALARLYKLEQAETLKAQWQATFDSIPHALCLTTSDFEILKLNRAFQQACRPQSFRGLIGKNCFHVFFGTDFQPPHLMASPFTFRNSRRTGNGTADGTAAVSADGSASGAASGVEHFEIVGETLGMTLDKSVGHANGNAGADAVQLIILRDITGEVRYERRILEASKLAELGTIGSSIAHELNNPLGGMLSFLQLILMDLKAGQAHHTEIKEMEKAVLRCRDIVQNLLSFARKQDPGEFKETDLNDVIERALKLTELQSKSKGIALDFERQAPALISGNINSLSQALCNILKNGIEAISEKIKSDPLFAGKISIQLDSQKDSQEDRQLVRVTDNGTGARSDFRSEILLAHNIIKEHRGTLEILSQTGSGTAAILALPKLARSGRLTAAT